MPRNERNRRRRQLPPAHRLRVPWRSTQLLLLILLTWERDFIHPLCCCKAVISHLSSENEGRHLGWRQVGSIQSTCHLIPSNPSLFIPFQSISFQFISFQSIPFHSILIHLFPIHLFPIQSIPFHSIPIQSISFHSNPSNSDPFQSNPSYSNPPHFIHPIPIFPNHIESIPIHLSYHPFNPPIRSLNLTFFCFFLISLVVGCRRQLSKPLPQDRLQSRQDNYGRWFQIFSS